MPKAPIRRVVRTLIATVITATAALQAHAFVLRDIPLPAEAVDSPVRVRLIYAASLVRANPGLALNVIARHRRQGVPVAQAWAIPKTAAAVPAAAHKLVKMTAVGALAIILPQTAPLAAPIAVIPARPATAVPATAEHTPA